MNRASNILPRAWTRVAIVASLVAPPMCGAAESGFACTTKNHKVVISSIDGGAYEYKSWKLSKSTADEPDLVLRNGKLSVEGTGVCRSRNWIFKSGKFEYAVTDSVDCGERRPPPNAVGQLTVSVSGDVKADWWCMK